MAVDRLSGSRNPVEMVSWNDAKTFVRKLSAGSAATSPAGAMALRWTATGLLESKKTFRRLKAHRQLPALRAALRELMRQRQASGAIETIKKAA